MNPKKSLGQHWLSDAKSLDSICDAADITKGDEVLEIGPGTGELTTRLLERGSNVTAIELDETLKMGLESKFKHLPFKLNMLSILDFDLSTLPIGYKIVANIPYYLTNHLLRMLTETQHKPSVAVLLVQKEVAERVTADQGKMSIVSVFVQLNYDVSKGVIVPANLFTPPPKVDSQVLILINRNARLYKDLDTDKFSRVVKAGFSQRRKTLLNSLSAGLGITKEEARERLNQVHINPNARPQELNLDDWHRLSKTI